jgi:hypothetical protein
MYHLEGNDPRVPVPTLLQAVEDFSKELTTQLRRNTIGPAYQPRSLRVQLVEDNGKETGLIGEPQTIGTVLRESLRGRNSSHR